MRVRRLEGGIGMALVTRTTRSVRLTEAGNGCVRLLSQPLSDIIGALEHPASQDQPRGLLRLVVTSIEEEAQFSSPASPRQIHQ
jgi:DNA-binding transcriptional LysR family regulator